MAVGAIGAMKGMPLAGSRSVPRIMGGQGEGDGLTQGDRVRSYVRQRAKNIRPPGPLIEPHKGRLVDLRA